MGVWWWHVQREAGDYNIPDALRSGGESGNQPLKADGGMTCAKQRPAQKAEDSAKGVPEGRLPDAFALGMAVWWWHVQRDAGDPNLPDALSSGGGSKKNQGRHRADRRKAAT